MSLLSSLNWGEVRAVYDLRENTHRTLLSYFTAKDLPRFCNLLLGVDDPAGNYSAAEHGLGPKILALNPDAHVRLHGLAAEFRSLSSARSVPEMIRRAAISHLQIGVGSEASCMMNPGVCWVANTRTIWAHLVVKHADNVRKANEELALYREADVHSEMEYAMWSEIHAELDVALTRLAEEGERHARSASVTPGPIRYLWADAIANELYTRYHT